MIEPDTKKRRTRKPNENRDAPANSQVFSDGFVRLPLRTVLLILNFRVEYSDQELNFINRETGEIDFCAARHPDGIRTPWDALRSAGLLDRPTFEPLALEFLQQNPRYAA